MFGWMQHMNFARWVILVSLLGSAVLGWFVYDLKAQQAQIEEDAERAPDLMKGLIASAHQLESLIDIASDRKDLENIATYITSTAANSQIELGPVDISPDSDNYGEGFEDEIYRIKPPRQVRQPQYTRTDLANFAFMLEKGTSLRVTRLRLFTPNHARFSPHEIGPDLWNFEMEVRLRKRKNQPGA